jgi:phage terminase large subunit-like protein
MTITNKEIADSYAEGVVTGKIVACEFVRLACQRYIDDLNKGLYYYNDTEVDAVINFINVLNLTEQETPKKFLLEDWQTFIIANVYGIFRKDTEKRKYLYGYIEMARKNGKSELATALALYHLLTDTDAQVVLSANSREQIKNVDFKKVKQFAVQLDKKQKYLKQYYNSIKYGNNELLVTAADSSRLDGLNASFCLIDELHEAPDNKLYSVLKSSMGSRTMPLFITITTSGFDTSSFCYQLREYCVNILNGIAVDEQQFAIVFTLDKDDDFKNPDVWMKANPNLQISVSPSFLASEVNKAAQFESEKNAVLVKHFNVWTKHNSLDVWIDEKYIVNSMKENLSMNDERFKDLECWVGVDLSTVSDISAVSFVIPLDDKYYVWNKYYLPEDSCNSSVNQHTYREAAALGYLTLTDGNVIDYDYILKDIVIVNERNPIIQLLYDRYNATQFIIKCSEQGINTLPFSQTAGNMNQPLKFMEMLFKSELIQIEKNPLTKWMITNVIIKQNNLGNYSINREDKQKKIDGVASMSNAFGGMLKSGRSTINVW